MNIRFITLNDLQAYHALFSEVIAEGGFFARTSAPPLAAVSRALEQAIKHRWPVYVSEHQGAIVGAAEVWPEDFCRPEGSEHIGVLGMQVKHHYRCKGHGRQLLERVLEHSRSIGFSAVELSVLRSNAAAIRLYTQAGFVDISAAGTPSTTAAMRLSLSLS